MWTSHRRMQTNINDIRRVTRRVQTSLDESLDECKQMQTNADKSKIVTLIPDGFSWYMVLFRRCCNYRTVGHIDMQIFDFIVLSVIISYLSFLTLHITKTHFSISSLSVRELELN